MRRAARCSDSRYRLPSRQSDAASAQKCERIDGEEYASRGEYERRHREAEQEAQAIVASARTEAERLAAEAKTKVEELIARRTGMAETKIAQAEAQAVAEVRAAAADAAVAAAERILADSAKGKVADDLIARGIGELKSKLN